MRWSAGLFYENGEQTTKPVNHFKAEKVSSMKFKIILYQTSVFFLTKQSVIYLKTILKHVL